MMATAQQHEAASCSANSSVTSSSARLAMTAWTWPLDSFPSAQASAVTGSVRIRRACARATTPRLRSGARGSAATPRRGSTIELVEAIGVERAHSGTDLGLEATGIGEYRSESSAPTGNLNFLDRFRQTLFYTKGF
jgi:hypothetical protein